MLSLLLLVTLYVYVHVSLARLCVGVGVPDVNSSANWSPAIYGKSSHWSWTNQLALMGFSLRCFPHFSHRVQRIFPRLFGLDTVFFCYSVVYCSIQCTSRWVDSVFIRLFIQVRCLVDFILPFVQQSILSVCFKVQSKYIPPLIPTICGCCCIQWSICQREIIFRPLSDTSFTQWALPRSGLECRPSTSTTTNRNYASSISSFSSFCRFASCFKLKCAKPFGYPS